MCIRDRIDDVLNMSGNSKRTQPRSIAQSIDSAWRMRNRGTVAKRLADRYNALSDEDKERFEKYSKSKGYNWKFMNRG